MASAEVAQVLVVNSVDSRSVSGINTCSTWMWWSVLLGELKWQQHRYNVVPVAVVDKFISRDVSGINRGSTSGCGGQYCP